MGLLFPPVSVLPIERYASLLGAAHMQRVLDRVAVLRARLSGRVVWNISSTAVSGGVAEMVRTLLAYARGACVDARWVVITGTPGFFRVTKRLHNALHGHAGDGSPLGPDERRIYDEVTAVNAAELAPLVRPGDVVIVHDPQPAGLLPMLVARGALAIWRCHIGADAHNFEFERGWHFLAPYLPPAQAYVFSRASYAPALLDRSRVHVIPPSIDPFSPKNELLDEATVRGILAFTGIIGGGAGGSTVFALEDGTPARVDRTAEIVREGAPPPPDTPLVVQVSRWDRLKDPIGVLMGFARLDREDAQLVLAGPTPAGVSDDPEGAEVHAEVTAAWRALPSRVRRRCHLVSLPTEDIEENAAIVNALQRHATVVVQKSLHEGFGLTVSEAMWKSRPVVASAVGAIPDQIDDGVEGLLIADPRDGSAFAAALARVLGDPELARRMGQAGHRRVLEQFLGIYSLLRFGAVIEGIDEANAQVSAPL
jgi:trehalose synthase